MGNTTEFSLDERIALLNKMINEDTYLKDSTGFGSDLIAALQADDLRSSIIEQISISIGASGYLSQVLDLALENPCIMCVIIKALSDIRPLLDMEGTDTSWTYVAYNTIKVKLAFNIMTNRVFMIETIVASASTNLDFRIKLVNLLNGLFNDTLKVISQTVNHLSAWFDGLLTDYYKIQIRSAVSRPENRKEFLERLRCGWNNSQVLINRLIDKIDHSLFDKGYSEYIRSTKSSDVGQRTAQLIEIVGSTLHDASKIITNAWFNVSQRFHAIIKDMHCFLNELIREIELNQSMQIEKGIDDIISKLAVFKNCFESETSRMAEVAVKEAYSIFGVIAAEVNALGRGKHISVMYHPDADIYSSELRDKTQVAGPENGKITVSLRELRYLLKNIEALRIEIDTSASAINKAMDIANQAVGEFPQSYVRSSAVAVTGLCTKMLNDRTKASNELQILHSSLAKVIDGYEKLEYEFS